MTTKATEPSLLDQLRQLIQENTLSDREITSTRVAFAMWGRQEKAIGMFVREHWNELIESLEDLERYKGALEMLQSGEFPPFVCDRLERKYYALGFIKGSDYVQCLECTGWSIQGQSCPNCQGTHVVLSATARSFVKELEAEGKW